MSTSPTDKLIDDIQSELAEEKDRLNDGFRHLHEYLEEKRSQLREIVTQAAIRQAKTDVLSLERVLQGEKSYAARLQTTMQQQEGEIARLKIALAESEAKHMEGPFPSEDGAPEDESATTITGPASRLEELTAWQREIARKAQEALSTPDSTPSSTPPDECPDCGCRSIAVQTSQPPRPPTTVRTFKCGSVFDGDNQWSSCNDC